MTNEKSNRFNELYTNLEEIERTYFEEVTIRLLRVNFLLRIINSNLYNYILNNREIFELFFEYLNFEFIIKEDKELVYIKNNNSLFNKKFTRNETICLLVLRSLYQKHLEEVNLYDKVMIKVKELQDKFYACAFDNYGSERVKKSTLLEMLKTFKDHNIITYLNDELIYDDCYITIYPSIEVVMDFKSIEEIVNRLELLSRNEDDNND